eukprot:403351648
MMLEEAFNKQGINFAPEIDSAINGLEGINKMIEKAALSCCKVPYKLILIDLNMPKMGGLQMIKNIRENISIRDHWSATKIQCLYFALPRTKSVLHPIKTQALILSWKNQLI